MGSPTALADYNAIPIQADPGLASGATITLGANGALVFDGADGHYQAVTGQVIGDVRYTNSTTGPTFTAGFLTLARRRKRSGSTAVIVSPHQPRRRRSSGSGRRRIRQIVGWAIHDASGCQQLEAPGMPTKGCPSCKVLAATAAE
jgi:sugar/nucleoside kinase (ribokinase family)